MSKTIAVGVITDAGGAHLDAYFTSLAQTEEAGSVALADPSGRSEALACKLLGTKLMGVYKDPGALLRQARPQMVLVSLEAVQAPPAIARALNAGCHVLAEKPACVRAEDFARLTYSSQQKHRHLMLPLANRLHAPVREARRLLQEGKFGKVYGVEVHLIADQTRLKRPAYQQSWVAQKTRAGGGHLIWLGIHWLDLALHITGLRAKQVAGFAGVVGGQPLDVEDSAAVALRFSNDTFGTLTSGYYLDRGYHSHLQVWGEHGWLRLASIEEAPLEWYSTKDVTQPKVERFTYPRGGRGYAPFVRACVRASAGLEPAPITAEEGLHVLQTTFAFYQAAQDGRARTVS